MTIDEQIESTSNKSLVEKTAKRCEHLIKKDGYAKVSGASSYCMVHIRDTLNTDFYTAVALKLEENKNYKSHRLSIGNDFIVVKNKNIFERFPVIGIAIIPFIIALAGAVVSLWIAQYPSQEQTKKDQAQDAQLIHLNDSLKNLEDSVNFLKRQ